MRILGVLGISVLHGQRDFHGFQGHAQKAHDPHPEKSPWPSQCNRNGYSANVSKADGGGKCGTKGLKMVYGARVVRAVEFAPRDSHPVT